jgi:amino acid adenylation domain-containing protein
MRIDQLIEELAAAGVYLAVRNGKLVCKASESALTPERRQLIGEHKADFIALLASGIADNTMPEPSLVRRHVGSAPLSPTQQRLWFVDQLTESSANYIIPVTYRLDGALDATALERALRKVMIRHESLRTVIAMREGEPEALVLDTVDLAFVPQSLEGLDAVAQEHFVDERLQEALAQPFDLAREIPLRAQLFRLAPNVHVLMLVLHHIASDGWSVENLLRELSTLYAAFREGRADPLPPLTLQYADYAQWQRQWLQGERLQGALDYWRGQLTGAPATHGLPLDHPRPPHALRMGASWRQRLPPPLHPALLELGRRQGATLFMTMQAAFAVLIARWSGNHDVVVGTPVANRPRPELAPLIGFFANTLALRLVMEGNPTFIDVLRQAKITALDAYDHQHLPFDLLVEDLNPPRSLGLAPVFQIMFSLQDIDEAAALDLPGLRAEAIVPDAINAKFDLSLSLLETADGISACWDYSRELFDTQTIASLGASFETLLQGIVADPTQHITQLPLLDATTEAQVLALGNDTDHAYPGDACLHTLVERRAARQPDAPAVIHEGESWSYARLNRQASRLAHYLRRQGVGPEVPVALVMERSPELLVGLLAILKAGGAYVPMEADSPSQRLQYLLADSAPRLVLSHGAGITAVRQALSALGADHPVPTVLDIDADAPAWAHESEADPSSAETGLTPDHLAYIIYTSGSTGHPKGVMNTHRGVVNRVRWLQESYPHYGTDRVLQKTPIGFDVSVREIFQGLIAGACLVQARPDGHRDPSYLVDLIGRERVTVLSFVPSMLQAFLEHPRAAGCHSIRRIFSGGEALSGTLVRRCREAFPQASLHNFYGPTEAAISVTGWNCPESMPPEVIPIGKQGANTRIYILDEAGRPVPRGMRGEIHIAGVQVARGYLNRPELTAERFVADPFAPIPGGRMYRTGDLGRHLADGNIEYLGRNDFQVKIRGQRVELGEIEAQLRSCACVDQAVVQVRNDSRGEAQLVAYVVPGDAGLPYETLTWDLRRQLQAQLPSHMLPVAYVALARLPVTANGKLDAKALPAPTEDAYPTFTYEAPGTPLEQRLASLWEGLLGHGPIGVTANFFDLGGHSLLLTRLHNKINAEYGIELALKRLFEAQTVRDQAAMLEPLLRGAASASSLALQPRSPGAPSVLSFAQRRLWFIDQMGEAGAVYNIPCALRLTGPLQPDALRQALQGIVRRHEVLRTTLLPVAGEAQPRLIEDFELRLPVHDLCALEPAARAESVRQRLLAEAETPFDLGADLFLRAQLLRLDEHEHALLLTLHHIAADGWSMAILLRELADLYENAIHSRPSTLAPLALQYADYANWQQRWLQGERLRTQMSYWMKQLAGLPTVHSLPLDFPRPEQQRYRGAMQRQRMPATLLDDIKQLARTHDATLFMILQAAFAILLARWSGETDIVMGTPIANRRHEQLAPLIGFFVNSLVLRNDLSDNPMFTDALAAARTMALDAYQHQDLPFEMLVDHLRPQRSLGHGPLFQVMLALENNTSAIVPFGGLEVADMADDAHFAKFDLTLNLRETPDGLEAVWNYNRDIFRAATIARFAASFEVLLRDIVASPGKRIQQLSLLAEEERLRQTVRGPELSLPDATGVHELIAAAASSAPDTIAIQDGPRNISYSALNLRANRVAHALRRLGVGPDRRVAIHTERSIETVVGILAVFKAGGAYVPLDPAHPAERLTSMLSDCGATAILTRGSLWKTWEGHEIPRLALDDEAAFASFADTDPIVDGLSRGHLAYVIYTSGSTGVPKGAMIEHAALLNMVESCRPLLRDDRPTASAWWASFGFDVSVFEILTTLAMGGTLHIVPEDVRVDIPAYVEWLRFHRITQAFLSPFIVRRLREYPDEQIASLFLRRVLVGVEPLQESELCRIKRLLPEIHLVNSYGPTETTFYCTYYEGIGDAPRNAPIGRPIANTWIYVLDDAMQPVPDGVVGEIYIAGACVGRGYLDQPERTAERFLQDASGARMYKSGDLARWTHDGQLEFRGRRDFQVKLNGIRIELGEIEAMLVSHPEVREAAVVVRADQGPENRKLVAYVVPRTGSMLSIDGLREHMTQRLPPYMLPATYVTLQTLPLTVNGKLDTKALPSPAPDTYASSSRVPPATELEHRLAAIWRELLQLERVGVTDNFFDLGGHSLKAVLLMSRLREATGKALPISVLFKAPTIRALATQVESRSATTGESFVQLRSGGHREPLFVFHAAGGDVLCYQPLLRHLDPDMPVYGFHRSELSDQRVPAFHSLEQLADKYLPRLLQEQPRGPYYLAGWSSGGLLALEMAARLERAGHAVAMVMLIDTMLATGTDLPARFHDVGLAELARLPAKAACDLMREFEPDLPEVKPRDGLLPIPSSDYFNYLVAANQIGIDFHRPTFRLKSPVRYFGCNLNRSFRTVEQRAAGIQALAQAPVIRESFEATHFSIMEEPDVTELGRAMTAAIKDCREGNESPEVFASPIVGLSPEPMA